MTEQIFNAKIDSLRWSMERGLSCHLFVEWGDGWGCGFGGFGLRGEACADWVTQIMKVLEIENMTDKIIHGKIIRIKVENQQVKAIGNAIKDIWFNPSEFYKQKYGTG